MLLKIAHRGIIMLLMVDSPSYQMSASICARPFHTLIYML